MPEIMKKLGRIFQYFNQGLSGYLGVAISLVSSLLIIYNYLIAKYLPTSPIVFIILLVLVSLCSLAIGWFAKKSGFWAGSNELGAEINPWLSRILGEKELISYKLSLINTNLSIEDTKLKTRFYADNGYDTRPLELELSRLTDYKKNIEELIADASGVKGKE